ncbi:hypothetical protein niasHT_038082 [Heterodera trifolii]|uniref:RING finger protein 207 n=1 Tax=Heterodera trifolii TaxID=157864 RepID=A0ABD2HNJ5_9BILA
MVDEKEGICIDTVQRNPLDCLRCFSAIKCPVRLPCQHYFCRLCIADEKCCVICGHPIGCSELVEDKVLNYVLESSSEVTETCANCDQISQPMFFCDTCHQPLCSGCRETTHKAKIFSTHHIFELDERGRLRSRPICPQHNEPFILFCLDSKSLMCIECFNSSSLERRGHFVNIDLAHKICCDKLEKNALNLRIFQEELREQIELRKRLMDELSKNSENLREEIDQKCDVIIDRLNELRRHLLDRVVEEKAEKQRKLSAQLNKLITLGSPISVNLLSVSIFCSYASKIDVLHCYADLHKSIQQFLSSYGQELIQKVKFDCNFNIDFPSEFALSVCQPLGLSTLSFADNSSAHGIFLNCDPNSRSNTMGHSSFDHTKSSSQKRRKTLDDFPADDSAPSKTGIAAPSLLSEEEIKSFPSVAVENFSASENGTVKKLTDDFAIEFNHSSVAITSQLESMNLNGPPIVFEQRFSEQFRKIATPLNDFAYEISAISKILLDLQRDLTLRRCVVSPEDLLSKITNCEDAWKRLETHNRQVESIVNQSLKQFWRREIERIQNQQLAVRDKARELIQLRSLAKRAFKVAQQLKPFATQMASLIYVIDIRRSSDSVLPSPMEQICMQITKMEPDSESRVAAIEKEETLRREAKLEEEIAQTEDREALKARKALREVRPATPKMRTSNQRVKETDRDRGADALIREGTHSCLSSPCPSKKRHQQQVNRRVHRNSESKVYEPLQQDNVVNSVIANLCEKEELPRQNTMQKQTKTNENTIPCERKDNIKREMETETTAEKETNSQNVESANAVVTAQVTRGRDPELLQAREKLLEAIREKVKRIE